MCGFCGIWNYKTREPVQRELLRHMSDSIAHRGPDDSGEYYDDQAGVGLGFRRLAIIDLSPAGHQPMSNEDGKVWIIFNGEIYNYLSLRPLLQEQGHTFRSRADSEVLLHEYESSGAGLVEKINGMFAMAIWDARQQQMFFARDRLGKKPLYYYDDWQRLIFGSEMKTILADPSVPRQVDDGALAEYLGVGYVLAPRSILKGIQQLPAAHFMTFKGQACTPQRYWDWLAAFEHKERQQRSAEEVQEEVRDLLQTVVSERMMSDVPLGAFLSGGVDSSAVVAMMARSSSRPVKTFSIGFKEEAFSELPYARLVAQQYATEHYEYIVEPEDLRDLMPKLIYHFDEPFADSSAVPTYYVAKMARQEVTVCLSGDGGDEAMAGYGRYAKAMREAHINRLPEGLRRLVFGLPANLISPNMKGHSLLQRLAMNIEQRYAYSMRQIPARLLNGLLKPEMQKRIGQANTTSVEMAWQHAQGLGLIEQMQYTDGVTYLPGDILVKVDRTSMANSLEARAPLLDYRFMELMASLPQAMLFSEGKGKVIFKQALRGIVPDACLDRSKMGFGIPLQEWFGHQLNSYAAEVLLDSVTLGRDLWQENALRNLLKQARDHGTYEIQNTVWVLLVLEMWQRATL